MKGIHKKHELVFFYLVLLFLGVVTIYLISPLLKYLLVSVILAFAFKPLNDFFFKYTKNKWISSFIVTFCIFLLIVTPIWIMINNLARESQIAYYSIKGVFENSSSEVCENGEFLCNYINNIKYYLDTPTVKTYFSQTIDSLMGAGLKKTSEILSSIPKIIVGLFILFISLFYLLKENEVVKNNLEKVLPLSKSNFKILYDTSSNVTNSIIYGYFITAIIQGSIAYFGFKMINYFFSPAGTLLISAPLFWTMAIILFSVIPVLGAFMIWLPIALSLISKGISQGNNPTLYAGLFLILYGGLLISQIDTFIRPYLTSLKMKIHPLLIYIGIFGGIISFGFVGILLGPLILTLFISYLKLYKEGKI